MSRLRLRQEWVAVAQQYTNPPPEDLLSQSATRPGRMQAQQQRPPPPPPPAYWQLANEVRYLYDGRRVIQERDSNNVPLVSYTRGRDLSGRLEGAGGIGGLLARTSGYDGGNGTWTSHACYHADGNGNVTFLLAANQTLAARYVYDPFGNTVTQSGSLAEVNVYRFSSKEYHAASGLYYYLYRWYEPATQRWMNRDPIGEAGGINLYGYVRNRPTDAVDSNGLWTFGFGGQAGFGLIWSQQFSLGFYVGHSSQGGWSFGFLLSGFFGGGGPASAGAAGFVQATTAQRVCDLKGLSGQIGASGGEAIVGGGDFVFGEGYVGGEANIGVGGGLPVEIHGGGVISLGWDNQHGWRL